MLTGCKNVEGVGFVGKLEENGVSTYLIQFSYLILELSFSLFATRVSGATTGQYERLFDTIHFRSHRSCHGCYAQVRLCTLYRKYEYRLVIDILD